LLEQHWTLSGVVLPDAARFDEEVIATVVRVTGGNFRLLTGCWRRWNGCWTSTSSTG
jgi:hypothetical protein